ncbi:MAG: iron-containing alcohol dehydrogenase [Bacteroidales bacterium]|nr:iron-containing alcohol dehydrogenase [Bacteroidales bacterium]
MKDFTFYNPVRVHFGKEQLAKQTDELKIYDKILLTYGKGSIKRNGIYSRVIDLLGDKNIVEFGGIGANPEYETLMRAVELGREEKVDFILAVGGGSVIDGSKFIAAAINYKGDDPWDMLAKYDKFDSAIKLGTVLTLPATGSEMNSGAVITRKSSKEKLAFGSPLLMPVFSILQPEFMYSLPDIQISNGIVDAFVHTIEQYITYPVNGAVQDAYSAALLKVLIEQGPKVLENRSDYDANANLMWAATMALNGLLRTGVPEDWSTHMIGHEITALYGVDHAQTLAIVLPGVLTVMKDEKAEKLLHYAQNVWNIDTSDANRAIELAIEKTESFFNSVGIKTRLSDYDIPESAIGDICKKLEQKKYVKLGENRNINPEKVEKILKIRV